MPGKQPVGCIKEAQNTGSFTTGLLPGIAGTYYATRNPVRKICGRLTTNTEQGINDYAHRKTRVNTGFLGLFTIEWE